MTPEQKKMTDMAMVGRGPGGSFNITLRSPEAGELLYAVGDKVRFHMSPPPKLVEMSIMLMGRFWGTQMEWSAHSRAAVQAGLSADAAKAIGEGKRPVGLKPDEEAVYNFFSELFKTKQVSDATFAAVKNLVGERGLVDLLVSAGYYEFTCMFMNVDRIPLGPNQQPELKYLAKPIP
jgi:4-carboxymuconolactone decarboxylase